MIDKLYEFDLNQAKLSLFQKGNASPTEQEILVEIIRIFRDALLQKTDWRDLPSYPGTDQEEWRAYRQALRDLPNNSEPQLNDAGELINIVWPEKPNGGV